MPQRQLHSIKLLTKRLISRDIMELRFERPAGFMFLAGQFVQFQVPNGENVVFRSYSLSSDPEAGYLEICAKILSDGKASQFFSQLNIGDAVMVSDPAGNFVCEKNHDPAKVFVATGTGIAPIMSMIVSELTRKDVTPRLRLCFGVRSVEDLFWQERLEELKQGSAYFDYTITLSQPTPAWTGRAGRVTEHLPATSNPADYYLCGNVEMVKEVRALLLAQGIDQKHIHFEIF